MLLTCIENVIANAMSTKDTIPAMTQRVLLPQFTILCTSLVP